VRLRARRLKQGRGWSKGEVCKPPFHDSGGLVRVLPTGVGRRFGRHGSQGVGGKRNGGLQWLDREVVLRLQSSRNICLKVLGSDRHLNWGHYYWSVGKGEGGRKLPGVNEVGGTRKARTKNGDSDFSGFK